MERENPGNPKEIEMVSLDDAVIARLESHGERFEILIDPDAVEDIREGRIEDVLQYMAAEEVFRDAHKGDRASEDMIKKVFGTTDVNEVARAIIGKGDVQLTTDQRRKMQEEKKRQIVAEIARNAINPQTRTPHPPSRIEAAMEEAHVHIDPFKAADKQVQTVLNAIKPIIPIRFEKVRIAVHASGDVYGKIYGDIVSYGTIIKEEWQPNGSWIGVVEMPAGLQVEFLDKIGKKSKGEIETKILNN